MSCACHPRCRPRRVMMDSLSFYLPKVRRTLPIRHGAGDPRSARTNKEAAGYNTHNTRKKKGKKNETACLSCRDTASVRECKSAPAMSLKRVGLFFFFLCLFPRSAALLYYILHCCHKFMLECLWNAAVPSYSSLRSIHHWTRDC